MRDTQERFKHDCELIKPFVAENPNEVKGYQLELLNYVEVDCSNVKTAILDTGNRAHEDLPNPNVTYSYYNTPDDVHGHQTHVTGIYCALGNEVGIKGLCNSQREAYKVLSDNATGSRFTIAQGMTRSVDEGNDIMSLSLGSVGAQGVINEQMAIAAKHAYDNGVIVIAAAGNHGNGELADKLACPACIDTVFQCCSVERNKSKSSYSAYKPKDVNFATFGSNIYSTTNDGGYAAWSGTSMATPQLAAVFAVSVALEKKYQGDKYVKNSAMVDQHYKNVADSS